MDDQRNEIRFPKGEWIYVPHPERIDAPFGLLSNGTEEPFLGVKWL